MFLVFFCGTFNDFKHNTHSHTHTQTKYMCETCTNLILIQRKQEKDV